MARAQPDATWFPNGIDVLFEFRPHSGNSGELTRVTSLLYVPSVPLSTDSSLYSINRLLGSPAGVRGRGRENVLYILGLDVNGAGVLCTIWCELGSGLIHRRRRIFRGG